MARPKTAVQFALCRLASCEGPFWLPHRHPPPLQSLTFWGRKQPMSPWTHARAFTTVTRSMQLSKAVCRNAHDRSMAGSTARTRAPSCSMYAVNHPLLAPKSTAWHERRAQSWRNEAMASRMCGSGSLLPLPVIKQQKDRAGLLYRSHEPAVVSITRWTGENGQRAGMVYDRANNSASPHHLKPRSSGLRCWQRSIACVVLDALTQQRCGARGLARLSTQQRQQHVAARAGGQHGAAQESGLGGYTRYKKQGP